MLSVLIPIEASEALPSVLDTGLVFARRYGRYVEGISLHPSTVSAMAYGELGAPLTLYHDIEREHREAVPRARDSFREALRAHGLDLDAAPPTPDGLSAHFNAEAPAGDDGLGQYARLFDVTVVGQPGPNAKAPRQATLEAVLFEGGRPILLVPPEVPATLGETVVVAWNGSTETARTVAFARPLLARARRVVVLSVEGGMVDGPTAADAARALGRVGIDAEARHVPQSKGTGPTILTECRSLGADLLVKGAYTQSRLRQVIFGGATRHLIDIAHLPVFMAH